MVGFTCVRSPCQVGRSAYREPPVDVGVIRGDPLVGELLGVSAPEFRVGKSTGGVVTSAGLVFAFTMLAMLSSDLRTIGQIGSTVCIGLLLDTLIVRSFVVPSILSILGKWFWWPTLVRSRPLPQR